MATSGADGIAHLHDHHQHHDHHDHPNHAHQAHHDHKDSDYGPMYEQDWVKKLLEHIKAFVQQRSAWFGMQPNRSQHVLDYACGDGVVSRTLLKHNPSAIFRGIDISTSQVERFNREAAHVLGDNHQERLHAVQGDILDPSSVLDQPEWKEFDIAIVSMALHHVKDPILFLETLRQRVRKGGTIVVLDWLQDQPAQSEKSAEIATNGKKYDQESMITVEGGNLKIWPGFSIQDIEEDLQAAGCSDVGMAIYTEEIEVPESMGGHGQLFIAKATAP